jgi:CBS domain-containing protein
LTVTVAPQSSAEEAAARMMAHEVGSVVIADDDGVWGILTREDLAETMPELMRDVRCGRCGSRQHLRHRVDGTFTCRPCLSGEALDRGEG